MMKSRFRSSTFFAALAGLLFTASCGGLPVSPDDPNTPPPNNGPKPNPAPGTIVYTISLPETSEPLVIWVEELSPPVGGKLIMGQEAYAQWGCGGPSGYVAFITAQFILAGQADPDPRDSSSGLSVKIGPKCDGGAIYRSRYTVTIETPVRIIFSNVWVVKGNSFPPLGYPASRPADAQVKIPLEWGF